MRILLVYPNARREIIGYGDEGAIAEPLALEYLASVGLQLGHEVRILDLRLHPLELELTLLSWQPDVVGLTGYSMHVIRMLEIAAIVRGALPMALTVVGGHHATVMADDFLVDQVDYVVVGEGTAPLRALLTQIAAGVDAPALLSVWSRVNGVFTFGGQAPKLEIDSLPAPARDIVGADRARYFIDWMRPIALLRTTVGCPYRCSFCSLWRVMDGQYLRRDIDYVVDEMASIQEKNIFLVDDEPFVNAKRMSAMASAIAERGLDHHYFAYCRIDTFLNHQDVMTQWRDIGLKRLFFGIEAISDAELLTYQKRQMRSQIVLALRTARELGIEVMSNFIVSPDYGHEDFAALTRFIEECEVDYPTFTILTPIPGTPSCASFDGILQLQANGRPDWQYFDLQHAVTQTRLAPDVFMREYVGLYRLFGHSYKRAGHPFYAATAPVPARAVRSPIWIAQQS